MLACITSLAFFWPSPCDHSLSLERFFQEGMITISLGEGKYGLRSKKKYYAKGIYICGWSTQFIAFHEVKPAPPTQGSLHIWKLITLNLKALKLAIHFALKSFILINYHLTTSLIEIVTSLHWKVKIRVIVSYIFKQFPIYFYFSNNQGKFWKAPLLKMYFTKCHFIIDLRSILLFSCRFDQIILFFFFYTDEEVKNNNIVICLWKKCTIMT